MGLSEGTIRSATVQTISFGSISAQLTGNGEGGVRSDADSEGKKTKASVIDLILADLTGVKGSETQATPESAQTALNNRDIAAFLNQMAFSAPLGQQIPQGPPPGLGGATPSGGGSSGGGSSGGSKGTSGSKDSSEKIKETDSSEDEDGTKDLNDDGKIDKEDAKLQKEADAKKKE